MIDQFITEHSSYHGLSDSRVRQVRRSLGALRAHAGRELIQIDELAFESFLLDEVARGQAATTVRTTAHACKPFFRWAWRRGLIPADRYMRICDVPMPRLPAEANQPRPYARKELDVFWTAFDARWPKLKRVSTWTRWQKGIAKWPRVSNHCMRLQIDCIVSLALHCGLRQSEIWNLALDDFHYDNEYVVVQCGKGGKGREVPYTDQARAAAYAWIEARTVIAPSHDRPWLVLHPTATANSIMPSHPFNPMRRGRFTELLTTIPGAGKGDMHWQYHRMRHTCGTEWLRAGMSLELVSRLLGHASIGQTLGYAQIVRDDIHRSAARVGERFENAVGGLQRV